MSKKSNYKSPKNLLMELGIEKPDEIDIEAIAQHCNATIVYEPLQGCDARIIGTEERAIITVNNGVSIPRQRFSGAHELGHWMEDRGKNSFACAENQFNKEWSKRNPEVKANRYAAELLLPEFLFKEIVKNREIVFDVVIDLSEKFKTSITATAIRLVELGSYPSMVVCTEKNKRKWFFRNPNLPQGIWPVETPGVNSIANKILQGKASKNHADIRADNWITLEDSYEYYLNEDSIKISQDLVLSLLWWKDEQQILDIEENEEDVEDNWDLKWK